MAAMRRSLIAFVLFFAGGAAEAQIEKVVTARLQGYTLSALVTHREGARSFRHGIVLFPGRPGIMKLREDNGQPQYEQRGNFLVRSRHDWLDGETLVAVLDAPSDMWSSFPQEFRATARYGSDVASLLLEVSKLFAVKDWTFVGTSEGSISAFHAARMNPAIAKRVILTSSLWGPTPIGPGLSNANFEELAAPLLFVHHGDDPCEYTPYSEAQRYAEKTRSPLVTARGGSPETSGACRAFSAHGFVGMERPVVLAMRSWVKTGRVPPDLTR
jgi:hypothetical protein